MHFTFVFFSEFLYPNPDSRKHFASQQENNKTEIAHSSNAASSVSDCRYELFATVNDTIVLNFKTLMKNGCKDSDIRSDSLIAGSMSMALCCILCLLSA